MDEDSKATEEVQVLAYFPLKGKCGAVGCTGTVTAVSASERRPGGVSVVMVCSTHIGHLQQDGFDVWAYQATCGAPARPGGPPCGARSERLAVFRQGVDGLGVAFICPRHEVQFLDEAGRST